MQFATAAQIEDYVTAGKAVMTFESQKTGAHYTYRINKAKEGNSLFFVSVLTGPNNETDYTYLGILRWNSQDGEFQFQLTAKSKMTVDAKPVRAFNWVWNAVRGCRLPKNCTVHHEGSCGRCGRTLTTPESVESGIGPECAKKMGHVSKPRRRQPRASAQAINLVTRMHAPPPDSELEAGPAWLQ